VVFAFFASCYHEFAQIIRFLDILQTHATLYRSMVYFCYLITNHVNGKTYVGFATDPQQRWREHHRDAARGRGYALHEAIRKHGVENFSFEVICGGKNKLDMLKYVEPELIRQHNSHITKHGYNLKQDLCGANWNSAYGIKDGRFRSKIEEEKKFISERTKEKMDSKVRHHLSESLKSYYANGGVHAMKGKKHTPEAIQQMSASHLNMSDETKNKIGEAAERMWSNPESRQRVIHHLQHPSDETRQKMSAAKKGKTTWNKGKPNTWTAAHRSKTYIVTTPSGEELTVTNLSAFAREHGLSQGTLRMTAVGIRQSHKGYSCRFAT